LLTACLAADGGEIRLFFQVVEPAISVRAYNANLMQEYQLSNAASTMAMLESLVLIRSVAETCWNYLPSQAHQSMPKIVHLY
jgi:hypothetical protein